MELVFFIIIGIVVVFALIYLCCYLPRKFNKYVYVKYGLRNIISLSNNIKAFIPFIIGLAFIHGSMDNDKIIMILSIMGIGLICFSFYLSCYTISVSNMDSNDKLLGYVFSILSMIGVIVCALNIVSELSAKNKTTFEKVIGAGIYTANIFVFRPDLKEEEFDRVDIAIKSHTNINIKKIKFTIK